MMMMMMLLLLLLLLLWWWWWFSVRSEDLFLYMDIYMMCLSGFLGSKNGNMMLAVRLYGMSSYRVFLACELPRRKAETDPHPPLGDGNN